MPTLAATAATMATEAGAPPRRLPRPLCNRVTPRGDIVAQPARYDEATAVFGNRGVLHDAHRRLVRTSATRAWRSCRLRVQRTRKVQRDDVRSASNHRSDTRTVAHTGSAWVLVVFSGLASTACHPPSRLSHSLSRAEPRLQREEADAHVSWPLHRALLPRRADGARRWPSAVRLLPPC